MKSRLVILSMLVFGMLLSTAGAGLAVSGGSSNSAAQAQYGSDKTPPPPSNEVLGDQDRGAGENAPAGGTNPTQPARQVEAGVGDEESGTTLPFTGFAAIPILLGGIAMLTAGLVLRRRTNGDSR